MSDTIEITCKECGSKWIAPIIGCPKCKTITTNQTNEEINVKGKHPPRVWTDIFQHTVCKAKWDVCDIEYLSLSEHQEIVAEYEKTESQAVEDHHANVKLFETKLAEKDKEIAELNGRNFQQLLDLGSTYERHIERTSSDKAFSMKQDDWIKACQEIDALKFKLSRALSALENIVSMSKAMDITCYLIVRQLAEEASWALAEINSATPVLADKLADKFVFGQEVEDK